MDTTQLLLTIVLSLTGLLVVIVGVHLIFVLRDIRKTLKKANKLLDEFHVKPHELIKMINEAKLSSEFKAQKVDAPLNEPTHLRDMYHTNAPLENVLEKMKDVTQEKKQTKRFFIKK